MTPDAIPLHCYAERNLEVQVAYLLRQAGCRACHYESGDHLGDGRGQDRGRVDSQVGEPTA